jgi:membrane protein implicated in regulation of membrane protease activity
MPWWVWTVVGTILLGAELTFVDAQFYLVFIGTAALLVGMVGLGGIDLPEWLQWLAFAGLSLASMLLFRRRLYDVLRTHTKNVQSGPAGEEVVVPIDLGSRESCRLEHRGSTWTAQNVGDQTLAAGTRARIVRVDGLTLQIQAS